MAIIPAGLAANTNDPSGMAAVAGELFAPITGQELERSRRKDP